MPTILTIRRNPIRAATPPSRIGEIAYEDAAVGKWLGQLKADALYDGAVIAVMADHGESLRAHGEDTHGIFLYDETIRVPLVIKLPDGARRKPDPETARAGR